MYRESSRQHAFEPIHDTGAYVYLTREEGEQSGNYYIKEKQAFFDSSIEGDGQFTSGEIEIPSGEYRITVWCNDGSWGNSLLYAYSHNHAFLLRSEKVYCDPCEQERSVHVLVDHSISDLTIRFNTETTELSLTGTLIERVDRTGCFIWRYFLLDVLGMTIWAILKRLKKNRMSNETCIALEILGAGFVLAICPLFEEIPNGSDLSFHLWRIEAVKDCLLNGELVPRIYPKLLHGYGYASGVMYGDSFLYIPAVLRMMGMTVSGAYRMFVAIGIMAALGIGYHVFGTISGRRDIGAVCSVLYTLSVPCMTEWYIRAGIGGASAGIFIPLVFGALWLLYQDGNADNRRAQIWLIAGATGMIQSHIIMTFVTALTAAGILLLGIRRYLKKDKLLALIRSAVWILLLNASFLVPFMDYYLTTKMLVNTQDGLSARIQHTGAGMGDLLQYDLSGSLEELVWTFLGGAVLSMILLYGMYRMWRLFKGERTDCFENIVLIGFGISLLLCTRYFPWDYLSDQVGLVSSVAKSIQFPVRFRTGAVGLLVMLVCLMLKEIRQKKQVVCLSMSAVMLFVLMVGNLQMQNALYLQSGRSIYLEETGLSAGIGDQIGNGKEYIPAGVNMNSADVQNTGIIDAHQILESEERSRNQFRIFVNNQNNVDCAIELPLLYYKGYSAFDVNSRAHLVTDMGTTGRVRVTVPSGYQGTIKVKFQNVWYWNVAELITVLAWVSVIGLQIKRHDWKERFTKWKNKG